MTDYLAAVIVGITAGFGNAIGSYLANKHAVSHIDKLTEKVNKLTNVIERKQE